MVPSWTYGESVPAGTAALSIWHCFAWPILRLGPPRGAFGAAVGDPAPLVVRVWLSAAVAAAERAVDPYVLQLGHGDRDGRLRIGDLILISQAPEPEAPLAVVRGDGFSRLVRCSRSGRWRDVENGDPVADYPEVVGRGVAIVWGSL